MIEHQSRVEMKILQVNVVYNRGSTGKIVHDIHAELQKRGIDSVVCYGRRDRTKAPHVYKVCSELYSKLNNLLSRFTGWMYGGCFFSTNRLISIIKREKPDIVHLQCLNGYFINIYRLLDFLKKSNIRTVLTLHAEFMHTGGCGHALGCDKWLTGCGHCPKLREETKSLIFDRTHEAWVRMKNALNGFGDNLVVVSVSPWLMERAKRSPIMYDKKHCVIFNGIDTKVFKPYDTGELKKKHGISDEKIVFHATAYFNNDPNHIKGGYYVLKLAKAMRGLPVKFLIAGQYDLNIKVPENVELLGCIYNQKSLAEYYSMADVTLLTSRKETYSMICAESLCCGTPVVGFKAGAPEQISIPEFSCFVQFGDVPALLYNTRGMIEKGLDKEKIANIAAEIYSKEKMVSDYIGVYNDTKD